MPDIGGGFLQQQQQQQPQQPQQSLLEMAQAAMGSGDNPYAGKTLSQILTSTGPGGSYARFADMPNYEDMPGNYGGGSGPPPVNWGDTPATNENVSEAIQHLGQYRPEIAKTLQSSGAEGGFFSIPGVQGGTEIPWGYYPDQRKESPAPGLLGMSTNNWRLLPKQFQEPKYAMRAGHIIDRYFAQNPGIDTWTPMGPAYSYSTHVLGSGGHGYPLSIGYPHAPRTSFFPGQLEPGIPEGGPPGMGSGIT